MFSASALGVDGLLVSRMRMRSADGDRLSARQRIEAQLFGISASALGLPSRSLLVVKRVAARMNMARCPFAGAGSTGAIREELGRYASRARRPWFDTDASRADAVLFADDSELIACLIRDWLRGLVADRWWWTSVLGSVNPERWLREHVLQRGELLVPALSLLSTRTEVVLWIARLQEPDARQAVAAVVRAFALPLTATTNPFAPAAPLPIDGGWADPFTGEPTTSDRTVEPVSRLLAIVPELQTVALAREQRRLLALVCAAWQAPSWVRTPQFARAMAAIERSEDQPVSLAPLPQSVAPATGSSKDTPARGPSPPPRENDRLDTPSPLVMRRSSTVRIVPEPSAQELTPETSIESARTISLNSPILAPSPADRHALTRSRISIDATTARPAGATMPAVSPNAETSPHRFTAPSSAISRETDGPAIAIAASVETEYGGIFYLLNAWLAMGLYGDFTAPRATNFVLSPWDLAALAGRAWFGDEFLADPIWKTLADLAVRDPDCDPDRDRVLPERWLDQHLKRLTARLRSALGADGETDIPSIVCRHRARVEITASSVSVHLVLIELPLELRIAGLDRDPGWIPAAGRSVTFHFT